jgi:hypothetical protein
MSAAALGLASLVWLPLVPRPAALISTSPSDSSFVPSELADRALPEQHTSDVALVTAQPVQRPQSDTDLASRVRQAQAERTALDTLAHALGSVSAGQPAAEAIQQGDFGAARDQLQSLGDETDQLSDAAKQQLARALQQASASTTATDRQLADKERQAAQALTRSSYGEQRQALRGLADQLARSGARAEPSDQLQRDVGRLQQQTGGAAAGAGNQSGSGSSSLVNRPATTGAGIGTGSDPNMFGDPSRLDTTGQQVQVPSKLGTGQGVRPPDGTEDQTGANPTLGNRSVSELSRAQQTGQVAPEQNLVPGEQRPIIRGYFR